MERKDDLQSRLDRIKEWSAYEINWQYFRDLAALSVVDLCALSVGLHPDYTRLIGELSTIDPDEPIEEQDIEGIISYRNASFDECARRISVAMNHIQAGNLPVVPGSELPVDSETTAIKIADFVVWARSLTSWDMPDEMSAMGPYPVTEEEINTGEKPLGKRERDTLLTIIAAFCKYEGFNPQERGLAVKIAQMSDDLGAPVGDDTIRAVLAQIPDALSARKK